jgi:hypothetical protein
LPTKAGATPMHDPEVALLSDRSYDIVPFSDADLASLDNLLDKDMDPQLFCRDDNTVDTARLQQFIKKEINFYRDVYLSGAPGDRGYARNALTFYYSFLSGSFLDTFDSMFIVADDWYRVILFDAVQLGSEVDVLHYVDQFPGESFIMRGCGYMNCTYEVETGAARKLARQTARTAIL